MITTMTAGASIPRSISTVKIPLSFSQWLMMAAAIQKAQVAAKQIK